MPNTIFSCKRFLFFATYSLFLVIPSVAQDSIPKKVYYTQSIGDKSPPRIDGKLDEEIWNLVAWSGDYVEYTPEENTSPSEPTQMKILYDQKNLYVGFRCFDSSPDAIVKRLSRRDGFDGDWVEINIDSFYDLRTAFSFTSSVSGVIGDEFVTNDGQNWDSTWNPIWYLKTHIDDEGWTAEVKIPLSQLRFGKQEDQVWGIQSTRRFFRNEERSVWQRTPLNAPGWVSSFGELRGLKGLEPQKQLEIQPFVVSSNTTYEPEVGNPFRDGNDNQLNAGVDGKIGITNDLTMDFTINPDFGQVEADPSAIALDGFQIFFPEQRPFFIENKNIFDYRYATSRSLYTNGFDNIFYSRRIGRAPQGFAQFQSGEFVDQPAVSTILGAAKFSGKTRNGWSIGLLESLTAEENATISDGTNSREEAIEPLTNYLVGRLQKDFNNRNSYVGGIFTATNRSLTDNLDFLHEAAYSGGFDLRHQWKNRRYYLGANVIFSHVRGSQDAIRRTQNSFVRLFQRVDSPHVEVDENRTSLTGTGGNIQIGKASGNWRFENGISWNSPELELNDVGFQRQADDFRQYSWLSYRTTKPMEKVRSYTLNYRHRSVFDFSGRLNDVTFDANGFVNLNNNWFINGGITYRPINYSNFALRGGPRLKFPAQYSFRQGIISDSRDKLRINYTQSFLWGTDRSLFNYSVSGQLTYQPTNALQLAIAPTYTINNDKYQYVNTVFNETSNPKERYINGFIEQRTLSFPLRLDYIITPNLTVQYWGQPFISRGRYRDYTFVGEPTAGNINNRFIGITEDQTLRTPEGTIGFDLDNDSLFEYSLPNPDFEFVQWRSNMVLRWEYIRGSELFLVWSQDISTFGNSEEGLFEGLRNNLFNNKPQNIFLIKATYRFRR